MKKVVSIALGAAILLAGSFAFADNAAPAGGDDEVLLVDGTALHGKVTKQVIGKYVVVRTDDGKKQSIPWSQVKRVSAADNDDAASDPSLAPAALERTDVGPRTAAPERDRVASEPSQTAKSPDVQLEIGARTGYAFAAGDYVSGAPLGQADASGMIPGTSGGVPIALDLGLRISTRIYLGAFAQYAVISPSCITATAGSTISCDAHDVRGGLAVHVHINPRGVVDPWIGAGVGYEWLATSVAVSGAGPSGTVSHTLSGWNAADFMFGVDIHPSRAFGLGPFFEITSGSFGSDSATVTTGASSGSASGDISSSSAHQWISIGLRGTFDVALDDAARE